MDKNNVETKSLGIKMDQSNIVKLTKDGLEERKSRLENLINNIRPQVLKELSEARAQGDLSENADYDAAKNKQAEVEAEISELEDLLTHVEIIEDKTKGNKVKIGSTVVYKNISKNIVKELKIVGAIEADPTKDIPWVGDDSPIGRAILDAKIGEKRHVSTPKLNYDVEILEIK